MPVVLQIGEQEITDEDLFPLLVRYRMLPQLAREIIIDRGIADLEFTPEEQAQAQQQFYQQQQIEAEDRRQAWLQQQGMSEEQLTNIILRDLKLEKFKQGTWGHKLESHFLQSKGKLDRVVYSLIRTRDVGVAQELYFRIQENETSFADLARQYSQGPEAQTGGLIGPVELNTPHPKISQMLMASQPGQLYPPTQVGEWWITIRLEKYLAAQLDESMSKRLLNDLFQQWVKEQMQQVSYYTPS